MTQVSLPYSRGLVDGVVDNDHDLILEVLVVKDSVAQLPKGDVDMLSVVLMFIDNNKKTL